MAKWERNDGYSGEKTAYFGDLAVVICPPDFNDDGEWGYQAFNESDWEAVESGEREYEGYGFESEEAVMKYVESQLEN